MSFGDAYDNQSSFTITSPSSVVPDTLLPPEFSGLVDSVRLTVETDNDDIVDAWGVLRLPEGDFDVLRMNRTITTNAVLEVNTALFGWTVLDESNPLSAALGDFLDLLGENTTKSYQFFGADDKEILANLTYDDEGELLTAIYKGDLSTSTEEIDLRKAEVAAFPNPTFGDVTFELSNLPKGNYTVAVYNIIGKMLWSKPFDNNMNSMSVNLSNLRKGTYLYSVMDTNGRKISTKRLMIITP